METAVLLPGALEALDDELEEGGCMRAKSPRIMASG